MLTSSEHRAISRVAAAALAAALSLWGSSAAADPPGNNGTVKIANVGDLDKIPNNVPHQGCTFEVQWYGYDGGADVISHVTFEAWAPTADAGLSVSGPSSVDVGQDAASGAGTSTGLDAVASYTLSFSGGPPSQQGYHVRLTVETPHSLGNDTKTKMFWVQPCTPPPVTPTTPAPVTPTPPGTSPQTHPPAAPAGVPLVAPGTVALPKHLPTHTVQGAAQVKAPTAIEAGETADTSAGPGWLGGALIGFGALLVVAGARVWRRRGA